MIQDPRKVYDDYNVHYIFGLLKETGYIFSWPPGKKIVMKYLYEW